MYLGDMVKEAMSIDESSGLSRIWQYTHGNTNFAIIGTIDKDTKEDRTNEFLNLLKEVMNKDNHITYKKLHGNYTYDDGSIGSENSFMINNIDFNTAMNLMKSINQESIIWKDKNYFGFIDSNGNPDGEFSKDTKNMSFNKDDVEAFGSRLKSKHNKGQGFTFKLEQYTPIKPSRSSVRNLDGSNKMILEELFSIRID